MSDYRHWTSDEEKYIQEHWRLQTDGEMAAALDRSEGAVRTKRRELRCSPQKTWTPEELQYLEDHWGTVSIPGIAKKLGRTVNAIKVRVARMGLGGMLNSGDYVTFNQLMRELTDNGQSYSYQMKSWVKNRGMPIHTKRVNACSFRVVYLEEFWEWAEQHRSFIDFSKLEPLALGKEPDWVAEQRRKDYQSFALQRKDPWSPDEDNNLIRLLKQQKYGYAELSEILRRSEGAIVRRCRDLGLKERPVRADPHRKGGSWSDEQHQILADGIRHGDSYSMIGRVIGKSEKALRGKIYFTYLTEDADKVRAMLGDGPWDIPNTLEDLQATVGGYIETVTIASDAVIICNEEGRLHGLPHNCRVFGVDFVGPILIAGVDEDEFTDLDSGAMGALLEGWGRSIKNAET